MKNRCASASPTIEQSFAGEAGEGGCGRRRSVALRMMKRRGPVDERCHSKVPFGHSSWSTGPRPEEDAEVGAVDDPVAVEVR